MKTKDLKETIQKLSYNELVDSLMEYAKTNKSMSTQIFLARIIPV